MVRGICVFVCEWIKRKSDGSQRFPESSVMTELSGLSLCFSLQKCASVLYVGVCWFAELKWSSTNLKETDGVKRQRARRDKTGRMWHCAYAWIAEQIKGILLKASVWHKQLTHFYSHSWLLGSPQLLRLLRIIACLSAGCHVMLPRARLIWLTLTALGARCLSCRKKNWAQSTLTLW